SNLDPFFVYLKMRFFWTIGAIIFVYLGTQLAFGSQRLAFLSALLGLLFAMNGSYAAVPGFSWAQLVPMSHASDVAMNVYLPGLVVLSFLFLSAERKLDSLLYLLATMSV